MLQSPPTERVGLVSPGDSHSRRIVATCRTQGTQSAGGAPASHQRMPAEGRAAAPSATHHFAPANRGGGHRPCPAAVAAADAVDLNFRHRCFGN